MSNLTLTRGFAGHELVGEKSLARPDRFFP